MFSNTKRKRVFLNYYKLLIAGAAALFISILFMLPVHAADELVTEKPVVVVTGQAVGLNETAYTLAELQQIADQDTSSYKRENSQYLYTAINTYPTKSVAMAEGVLLKTLLTRAGITDYMSQDISVSDRYEDYKIIFTPSKTTANTDLEYQSPESEIEKKITRALGVTRYYFPNFNSNDESARDQNAEQVEAIIAWATGVGVIKNGVFQPLEELKNYNNGQVRLFVGQLVPEDMNNPLWNGPTGLLSVCAGGRLTENILTVEEVNDTKSFIWTREDMLKMNRAGRNYGSDAVRGVPAKELFASYGGQTIIIFKNSAGEALDRVFTKQELVENNYMLAYETDDSQGGYDTIADQGEPVLMLYGDDLQEPYQVGAITLDQSLIEAYQAACTELDTYLNNEEVSYQDYKPAQQTEIKTIISNAKAQMSQAQTIAALTSIKIAAMRKMDAVKTASELDATDIKRAKITLSKTGFTYTGKEIKPSVTVILDGKTLRSGTQFKLTYSANKAIGTAKVAIQGTSGYWGSVTKTFTIKPGKVAWRKLIAGRKKLTAYYKALGGGVYYQVQARKAGARWKTYSAGKRAYKTIKKLKSRKRYSVRIRAYKRIGGKTYYGSWSSVKTVKVK